MWNRSIAFYADLFTQGWFEEDGYAYMDTQTDALHGDVSWTVDGETLVPETDMEQMDFNGDGLVSGEDAQALLDYITGVREEITNADAADLDGNGSVTSYDAHRFLRSLNSGVLTLPAGGKTEVQVTVTLTQAQKRGVGGAICKRRVCRGFLSLPSSFQPQKAWRGRSTPSPCWALRQLVRSSMFEKRHIY